MKKSGPCNLLISVKYANLLTTMISDEDTKMTMIVKKWSAEMSHKQNVFNQVTNLWPMSDV